MTSNSSVCPRCSGLLEEGDRFCQDCGLPLQSSFMRSPLLDGHQMYGDGQFVDLPFFLRSYDDLQQGQVGLAPHPPRPASAHPETVPDNHSWRSPISVPEWLLILAMTLYSGSTVYFLQKDHPQWLSNSVGNLFASRPNTSSKPAKVSANATEVDNLFKHSIKEASARSNVGSSDNAVARQSPRPNASASRSANNSGGLWQMRLPRNSGAAVEAASPSSPPWASGWSTPAQDSGDDRTAANPVLQTKPNEQAPARAESSAARNVDQPRSIAIVPERHVPERQVSKPVRTKVQTADNATPGGAEDRNPNGVSNVNSLAVTSESSTSESDQPTHEVTKKVKPKKLTTKEIDDLAGYNKMLAGYFSRRKDAGDPGHTDGTVNGDLPEPPSYDEWLKSGKADF